jgi:hypothetical protein
MHCADPVMAGSLLSSRLGKIRPFWGRSPEMSIPQQKRDKRVFFKKRPEIRWYLPFTGVSKKGGFPVI